MLTRICLSLALLAATPAWAQLESTPFEIPATQTDETQMLTPPPVSSEAYPTTVGSQMRSNYLAAGLIINNNNFAVEHQTEVNGYFAKAIQLAENQYLSVSLDGGVRSYVADYSGLAPDDPAFRNDVREFKTSIGFGILYYTNEYYLGFSLPQLTLRTLGDGSVLDNNYFRNSYYFSGAIIENLGEDIKIKPATLVSYTRGVPLIADISTTFYFKDVLGLGVDYRTNNEMAGIISLALGSFHVGYSYQFGTTSNNLGGINNATYEVTLSYRFGKGAANPKLL